MRFPNFQSHWKYKKLGQIVNFKITNSFSRDNLNYSEGHVKNIHYGDIHKKFYTLFNIEEETVPFINNDISLNKISKENYCYEGDIIFADASEDLEDVGKSIEILNLKDELLLSGLHTLLARPVDKLFYIGFLGYLLKSENVRKQIKKEAQGTKVFSINSRRVSKIEIFFPEIREQEKIAKTFSLLDKRIRTQSKIIENLESLMKGLRQEIYSQRLRFQNRYGNKFYDWKNVKLEDVLKIGSGRDYKHLKEGNIPVFGTGGFMTSVDKFLYDGESVGIGRKGTIDKPVFLKGRFWTVDTLFYTHSFKQVLPKFMYYLFLQINWKKYNEASGVPSLSKSTIEKIKIKIPSLAEQTKILNFLSLLDEKIRSEKYLLSQYEKQKRYLLQNMFI